MEKCLELKGPQSNSQTFHKPTRRIFRLIGEILVDNQRSRDLPVGHTSVVSPQMLKSSAYKTLQNITESIDVEKALNSSRPEDIHNLAASVICATPNRRYYVLNPMTDITDEQTKIIYMQMDLGRLDKSARCNLRFELLSPTVISPDNNAQSTPFTTQETNAEDGYGSNYLDSYQDSDNDEESESEEGMGDDEDGESKEDMGNDKSCENIVAKPKSGTNATDSYADIIARVFGAENAHDPVMHDIEQIPWKYLWLLLRQRNWKWDFGKGHSNCYFAPGCDVKSTQDAVWGVQIFDSEESVRKFVRKQNWPEFSPSVNTTSAEAINQAEKVIAITTTKRKRAITTTTKRKRESVSVTNQKRRRSSGKKQTKQMRKTKTKHQEKDEQKEDDQTSSSTGAEVGGEGEGEGGGDGDGDEQNEDDQTSSPTAFEDDLALDQGADSLSPQSYYSAVEWNSLDTERCTLQEQIKFLEMKDGTSKNRIAALEEELSRLNAVVNEKSAQIVAKDKRIFELESLLQTERLNRGAWTTPPPSRCV